MKRVLPLLCLLLSVACTRHNAVIDAVQAQLAEYPASRLQDVYKSFYQDRFGSGHMIADTAAVHAYLLYELELAAEDSVPNPYYEPTGAEGRYVRVYLRSVNEGLLSADELFEAFIQSAQPAQQPEQSWAEEWDAIVGQIRQAGITFPDFEQDNEQLKIAAQANRAVHHSDAYREKYHPHYRIVEKSIFQKIAEKFGSTKNFL